MKHFTLEKEVPGPSIFNDVLGPVMRGPSSSHTAAAQRIGMVVRNLCAQKIRHVEVEFHRKGALATTYLGQGSAMGLAGGLLGIEMTSEDMISYEKFLSAEGLTIDYKISDYAATHPNTYKIKVQYGKDEELQLTAISTGGGMFEVLAVDNFKVSIKGDYYESLVHFENLSEPEQDSIFLSLKNRLKDADLVISEAGNRTLFIVKSRVSTTEEIHGVFKKTKGFIRIRSADPVLPVLSGSPDPLPFSSFKQMTDWAKGKNMTLSDLALEYESKRSGLSKGEVFEKMRILVEITRNSIRQGLKGTNYRDRILGQQSHLILEAEKKGKIYKSTSNTIIAYTCAIMEVKSSMGIIIASPTAGSCGVLGGALFGAAGHLDVDGDLMVKGFLAAGLTGVFVARDYTFAAEEGGCQVECGAASGMAAAALTDMFGGTYLQSLNAASMSMQNMIGLICDPVADRVEVPCLGKNIIAATNALNNANMSLAGFEVVIPLDEVVGAMKAVGDQMPASLCCTGLSGLAATPCAKSIFEKLKSKKVS